MPGTKWTIHKGKRILYIDFSHSTFEDIKQTIEEAKPLIVKEPKDSILCVTNTEASKFTIDISNALKDFSLHNKPYMKMTALIGVEGLQKAIYSGVLLFTRRKNLVLKNSMDEALEWLITL